MLELRSSCECCGVPLPGDSPEARICSFECTFCAICAGAILLGSCPHCGGELVPRPIRSPALLMRHPAAPGRAITARGCLPRSAA